MKVFGVLVIAFVGCVCIYGAWLCGKVEQSKQDNVTLKETVDRDAQTIHNLEFQLGMVQADSTYYTALYHSVSLGLITLQEGYKKLKAQHSYLDEYYKRGEVVIQGR